MHGERRSLFGGPLIGGPARESARAEVRQNCDEPNCQADDSSGDYEGRRTMQPCTKPPPGGERQPPANASVTVAIL
ncbi:MAG: hypothetical protein WEB52_06465 [Dehalococcoidia bacterium]